MTPQRCLALAATALLAACTTNQVGSIPQPRPSGLSDVALQFAVGTATIAVAGAAPLRGTNFVATFRQQSGASAAAGDTPTVTGPGGLSLVGATPYQAIHTTDPEATFESDFGDVIGVFGSGFAPLNIESAAAFANYNAVGNGTGGIDSLACINPTPSQTRFGILASPLFTGDCAKGSLPSGSPAQATYAGGPPAWPSSQGYGYPSGFPGYALGFMDFSDKPPLPGTYALDVAVPTDIDAVDYQHFDATATLKPAFLPPLTQPTIDFPGDGSANVAFTVPAGITEAVVTIQRTPCVAPASGFVIPPNVAFALVTHQTGPQALSISANLGPPGASGTPTHSFCTAADITAGGGSKLYTLGFVGFDYPAYEASYPRNTEQTPKITTGNGHTGTADVTTAVPIATTPY